MNERAPCPVVSKLWAPRQGGDPWIESPPLSIDTDTYGKIEIDMRIDAPAEHGQLFWRHEGEGLDEARSLQFPLEIGRQRYTLALSEQAGWQGEIVFLRFDPIPENLNVNTCIYYIELKETR
jgi:hypothetical protein